MTAPYRPKLRPDVEFTRGDAGSEAALYDRPADRRVDLGKTGAVVARLLDGTRTIDEIANEAAAREPGTPRDHVIRALRTFLLLNLIEGAGTKIVDKLRAARAGAPLPITFLEESRFECQSSGACCRNYRFGPLKPSDCARIDALAPRIRETYPELGEGPWYEEAPAAGGQTAMFLKTSDRSCIFLREGGLCGLHAAFGPEAKPDLCSLYPWTALGTIDGLKIFDNGECASFATSAQRGRRLADDLERVRKLLPERIGLHHPALVLDPKTPLDFGWFLELQAALTVLISKRIGDATATVVAIGRMVRAFFDALAECPVAPGEPDATVERVLGREPGEWYAEPARPSPEGCLAIAGTATRVRRAIEEEVTGGNQELRELTRHWLVSGRAASEGMSVLHFVESVAAAAANPAAFPLFDWYAKAAAVPLLDPELAEAHRVSLRQVVFGQRLLIENRPRAGLLALALTHLVTVLGAKLRAAIGLASAVRPQDWSAAHALANRLFRLPHLERAFAAGDDAAFQAIEALPHVLGRLGPLEGETGTGAGPA